LFSTPHCSQQASYNHRADQPLGQPSGISLIGQRKTTYIPLLHPPTSPHIPRRHITPNFHRRTQSYHIIRCPTAISQPSLRSESTQPSCLSHESQTQLKASIGPSASSWSSSSQSRRRNGRRMCKSQRYRRRFRARARRGAQSRKRGVDIEWYPKYGEDVVTEFGGIVCLREALDFLVQS
jgi:hypothetical protein